MEKDFKILFIVVILILSFSGAFIYFSTYYVNYSGFNNNSSANDGKIIIVASVLPQKEFIDRVGGDKVQTIIMVPPGADPHTYEPRASQLQQVSRAQMFVQVGSGIEFEMVYMGKIKSLNPSMTIINDSKGINFIPSTEKEEEHSHEVEGNESDSHEAPDSESDPHVWVSPKNAQIMVENIYNGLVIVDPENKEYYFINKENYLKELRQLDKNITNEVLDKKGEKILVYHPSWGYFCRDYGFTQIAIENEGKDPTPQGMANLIYQAKKENIKVIFVSPQYSTRSAEVIAEEIGAKIVFIDELSPNYVSNMKKVADAFSDID